MGLLRQSQLGGAQRVLPEPNGPPRRRARGRAPHLLRPRLRRPALRPPRHRPPHPAAVPPGVRRPRVAVLPGRGAHEPREGGGWGGGGVLLRDPPGSQYPGPDREQVLHQLAVYLGAGAQGGRAGVSRQPPRGGCCRRAGSGCQGAGPGLLGGDRVGLPFRLRARLVGSLGCLVRRWPPKHTEVLCGQGTPGGPSPGRRFGRASGQGLPIAPRHQPRRASCSGPGHLCAHGRRCS
mmetsp:Transcript_83449/g.223263  ORF Transcript_83449/g.223263 Transcript_83449/m.223263 type:complete len:235 (-) Transcript_83449:86-790(-)